jgi:hypothetical protein
MSRIFRPMIGLGAAVAMAGGSAAIAHHSFAAEFDRNKPIKLEGAVVKFEWVNPHSWIPPAERSGVARRGRSSIGSAASGLEPELAARGHQDHRPGLPGS